MHVQLLKDSDFQEVGRAECQFTATTTVLDNGSLIPWEPPKHGIKGFFASIEYHSCEYFGRLKGPVL
ncbi:hypothetical protein L2E82_03652 [Cichorium intybus]|uniref:Uncharacterized protein n=1 Tax=Cichorium intybus TaxID=13427 RepID=A0ACB9H6F0_CICIN|nr:hypothetical protein L2E82_03652 [Cichorium intybus]